MATEANKMSAKFCGDRIIQSLKQHKFKYNSLHPRPSLLTFQRHNIHRCGIKSNSNLLLHQPSNNSSPFNHHIVSFCTQLKKQKEETEEQETDTIDETIANQDDEEYEEYEDEEDEDGEGEDQYEDEYEYEYETDDEFEEEEAGEGSIESKDDTDSIEMQSETAEQIETQPEISENFDFAAYSENVMNELFANLPQEGRLEGKSIEQYISPLILQPLERLDDDLHNKFTLMHNDLDNEFKKAYKSLMENEQELRDVINLAFDKLNVYTSYIDNNFDLRHSPRHYLMRQLRVDHGKIVHLAMRKIMYYKYPEWVESDNWASEEMSDHNLRKFLISEKLGIGMENLESIDQELNASDGSEIGIDAHEDETGEQADDLNDTETPEMTEETATDSVVEEETVQKETTE